MTTDERGRLEPDADMLEELDSELDLDELASISGGAEGPVGTVAGGPTGGAEGPKGMAAEGAAIKPVGRTGPVVMPGVPKRR